MFKKSDIIATFAKFKLMIENLLACLIQIICSDGGVEFDNKLLCSFLKSHNITHQLSYSYTYTIMLLRGNTMT